MQFAGIPSELVDVDIAIIIFFVGISFVIHYVLAKVFQSKKEAVVVKELEDNGDEDSQKGGTI